MAWPQISSGGGRLLHLLHCSAPDSSFKDTHPCEWTAPQVVAVHNWMVLRKRTSILWLHFPWQGFLLIYRQNCGRPAVPCAFFSFFCPNCFILLHLGMSCPDRNRFDRKMHNRRSPGVHSSSNLRLQQWNPAPMWPWAQGKKRWKKTDGRTESTQDLDSRDGVSLSSWSTDSPPGSFAAADLQSERHTKREASHRTGTRLRPAPLCRSDALSGTCPVYLPHLQEIVAYY